MIKTGSLLARQTALDLSHHTPHVKHPDAGLGDPAALKHLQWALDPLSPMQCLCVLHIASLVLVMLEGVWVNNFLVISGGRELVYNFVVS